MSCGHSFISFLCSAKFGIRLQIRGSAVMTSTSGLQRRVVRKEAHIAEEPVVSIFTVEE
jgi:hypothetical protein